MSECPHCKSGNLPFRRNDTGELVHSYMGEVRLPSGEIVKSPGAFSHTLCLNNHPPATVMLDPYTGKPTVL